MHTECHIDISEKSLATNNYAYFIRFPSASINLIS